MARPTYAAELRALADGVPNLDCYSVNADDVWKLAECLTRQSRHAGRIMFPHRTAGYVSATINLGHYAYNKATAMRCRARGDSLGAGNYDAICDRIYARLPEYARW